MNSIAFSSGSREIKQLILHEPEGQPRAVIQIVHGMAEHYARYYRLAEALQQQGYAVAGYDQIGHGPETPAELLGYLGDHNGWQRLIYDANTVHTILCEHWPHAPQVMLGHSMGSFVAREYVVQFGVDQLDGLVLSGTGWQDMGTIRPGLVIARLQCLRKNGAKRPSMLLHKLAFGGYNKGFRPARTDYDWLSRDEKEVDKYIADPLCGFPFTAGGYRDLFEGLRDLTLVHRLQHVPKDLPVLLISGENDPVGGKKGELVNKVAAQYRSAGLQDVQVKLYEGARHELFNEINRDQVQADLLAWLKRYD
ncbi:MAG: alpha/beta hydrolase [Clostridiales bacterium]|nr:alpha/beta hydrolase [Clostridiales bacterium]